MYENNFLIYLDNNEEILIQKDEHSYDQKYTFTHTQHTTS